MTNPAAAQNQEIDCLSPEAQRLVRRKHIFEAFGSDCQCLVLTDVLGAKGRRHLPPQSSVPGEVWGCLAWPGTPLNERPHASMGGGVVACSRFSSRFGVHCPPALRPGKHISLGNAPQQDGKELRLVPSARSYGLLTGSAQLRDSAADPAEV